MEQQMRVLFSFSWKFTGDLRGFMLQLFHCAGGLWFLVHEARVGVHSSEEFHA